MKLYKSDIFFVAFLFFSFAFNTENCSFAENSGVIFTKVICKQPGRYIGWPTVAKTKSGELLAVFSGDRDEHVCPWGKTQLVRSKDNGKTWSEPETINNTPLDDRDAGILVLSDDTIIVTWFTSVAFDEPGYKKYYPDSVTNQWKKHAEKLTPEIRKQWLGSWTRRSTDNGKTWEDPVRAQGSSPHGPVQLKNGNVLYVGRTYWEDTPAISAEISEDSGKSWKRIGTIPLPAGDDIKYYHEPHAAELSDGTIIAMIRYEKDNTIMQSESHDGGKTWTTAHPTGIWGCPPHIIKTSDNRLLCVYGYRREPFSERACISFDNGKTWDTEKNETILTNAPNGDLGYPASVELSDGSIFTVYYQVDKPGEKTCLMGTCWKIK